MATVERHMNADNTQVMHVDAFSIAREPGPTVESRLADDGCDEICTPMIEPRLGGSRIAAARLPG